MKYIFIVQAEGRGHMTQAIALGKLLTNHGHKVAHVFIGRSKRRTIPQYFIDAFDCDIEEIDSPNFVTDANNRKIELTATIFHNLKFAGKYFSSFYKINKRVRKMQPDSVINFYDLIGGLYFSLFRPRTKHIAIGHQYLAGHPEFPFANHRDSEKNLFLLNNRLMSMRSFRKVALSFSEYQPLVFKDIHVVPPLIRDEVLSLKPVREDFILGYMVNDGYGDDMIKWHEQNREVVMHCFWDRKGVPDPYQPHENITFHQLDNVKFLDHMRRCKGYVTTAGFESVCEALYLGKPVLMVPVEGQYEQACNALDGMAAGAGITSNTFDIELLVRYIGHHPEEGNLKFRKWHQAADELLLKALTIF